MQLMQGAAGNGIKDFWMLPDGWDAFKLNRRVFVLHV